MADLEIENKQGRYADPTSLEYITWWLQQRRKKRKEGDNGASVEVKSLVLDIANNWGDSFMGLRSVELVRDGFTIPLTSGFSAYSTTRHPSYSAPEQVFNTSLSKSGIWFDVGWLSVLNANGNQRLILVLDNPQEINGIIINNHHSTGGELTRGIKDTKITVSTDAITDTTYNAEVTSSTVIFNGEIPQHNAVDGADDYTVPLTI